MHTVKYCSLHAKMSLSAMNSCTYLCDVMGIQLTFCGLYGYFIGCIVVGTFGREQWSDHCNTPNIWPGADCY